MKEKSLFDDHYRMIMGIITQAADNQTLIAIKQINENGAEDYIFGNIEEDGQIAPLGRLFTEDEMNSKSI